MLNFSFFLPPYPQIFWKIVLDVPIIKIVTATIFLTQLLFIWQLIFRNTFSHLISFSFHPPHHPFGCYYPKWSFQYEITRENKIKTDMVCEPVIMPRRRMRQNKELKLFAFVVGGEGRWQGRAQEEWHLNKNMKEAGEAGTTESQRREQQGAWCGPGLTGNYSGSFERWGA